MKRTINIKHCHICETFTFECIVKGVFSVDFLGNILKVLYFLDTFVCNLDFIKLMSFGEKLVKENRISVSSNCR